MQKIKNISLHKIKSLELCGGHAMFYEVGTQFVNKIGITIMSHWLFNKCVSRHTGWCRNSR